MSDASTTDGAISVPYADDGYAQYQLDLCRHDQNSFDQVLTIISIVAAATVFFQRIRNKEHRKFPDNIFTMMLITLCGIHLALLISIASENRVVTVKTQPWQSLCQLQARMFHWCSCAAIWNVCCVVVTLHHVIVRKTPIAELAHYNRLYYATLAGLPSLAVLACSIFGNYGPYPGLHNCWIEPGAGRLFYFHTFTLVTFIVCVALAPPTIFALRNAYRHASQPQSVGLFRSLMWRQIILAVFGVAVVGTFLLGGINNMLLESHKQSAYIKSTAYPLCISSAISFASLGLFVSVIYWSTRRQSLMLRKKLVHVACCGRFQKYHANDHNQHCDQDDELEANPQYDQKKSMFSLRRAPVLVSAHNVSPGSPYVREPLRSALDSDGRSVVSVPPDPQHRAAHQVATHAYTSTLLEYVREQLLDELEAAEDSDFSSSSYESDSDGRNSSASENSMDDCLAHSDASYPATPQSHFRKIVPHEDCLSAHRELALNRKEAITEL